MEPVDFLTETCYHSHRYRELAIVQVNLSDIQASQSEDFHDYMISLNNPW